MNRLGALILLTASLCASASPQFNITEYTFPSTLTKAQKTCNSQRPRAIELDIHNKISDRVLDLPRDFLPSAVYDRLVDFNEDSSPDVGVSSELEPKGCTADELNGVSEWVEPPYDSAKCIVEYSHVATLGSCCGGVRSENSRSMRIEPEFAAGNPEMEFLYVDIEKEYEQRPCCDYCVCWGDPHCKPLGPNKVNNTQTFIVCDNSVKDDTGVCSGRRDVDDGARDRCLGTASGYEENGNGRCIWRPNHTNGTYDVNRSGHPCAPNPDYDHNDLKMTSFTTVIGGDQSENRRLATKKRLTLELFNNVKGGGSTQKLTLQATVQDGDETVDQLSMNSNKDCSKFDNLAQAHLQLTHVANGTNLQVYDSEALLMYRQVETSHNKQHMDIVWTVVSKGEPVEGATVAEMEIRCRGGTVENDAALFNKNAHLYTMRETPRKKSLSTRTESLTYLDVKYKQTTVPNRRRMDAFPEDFDPGFCATGEMSAVSTRKNSCNVVRSLTFADRDALSQMPSCKAILENANCGEFHDFHYRAVDESEWPAWAEQRHYKRSFKQYKAILDICVHDYCANAEYPPSVSADECITSFYDFGVDATIDQFRQIGVSQAESYQPMQHGCTENITVTVFYEGANGSPVELGEQLYTNGTLVFPMVQNGEIRKLQEVVVKQNSCANVCGTRPKLKITTSSAMLTADGDLPDQYVIVKRGCDVAQQLLEEQECL